MVKKNVQKWLLRLWVVLICVVVVFPFYWMVATSVTSSSKIFEYPPRLVPQSLDFKGFIEVLTQKDLLRWLSNSTLVSSLATVFTIMVSSLGAYALSRFQFKGKGLVAFITLATQMIPTTLLLIPVFIIFSSLKMTNTYSGLVLLYVGTSVPVCTWFLKGFFDSIPIELEEAAKVDGCDRVEVLYRIVLPLSLPGLVSTSIYAFILAWTDFMYALTLMTKSSKRMVAVGLYSFIGEYTVPWHEIMAASVISTIPVLVLFLFMQKYLVHGLTAGAVKG